MSAQPERNHTPIQQLARLYAERIRAYGDAEQADDAARVDKAIEAAEFTRKAIMLTPAENMAGAVLQIAAAWHDIDILRSPGPKVDPDALAERMQDALTSALFALLPYVEIDPHVWGEMFPPMRGHPYQPITTPAGPEEFVT